MPQGCQDRILQIATRVSITVVLPSGLRKPLFVTPGAALATAIYLSNQAISPTLPDSMLTNQVSASASARQGLCSFGLAISPALALHTLPGHAVWLQPRSWMFIQVLFAKVRQNNRVGVASTLCLSFCLLTCLCPHRCMRTSPTQGQALSISPEQVLFPGKAQQFR